MAAKREIMYEIERPIAQISEKGSVTKNLKGSVTKNLNIVSWAGKPAKYDLRVWRRDAEGNAMPGKGITLDADEMDALRKAIDTLQDAGQGFPCLEQ